MSDSIEERELFLRFIRAHSAMVNDDMRNPVKTEMLHRAYDAAVKAYNELQEISPNPHRDGIGSLK